MAKEKDKYLEFFRYHSIYPSTTANLLRLFYNKPDFDFSPEEYDTLSPEIQIFQFMENEGYITAHSADMC